ncbi:Protein transport protein sec13 [Schizosaccharomyces pombe]|uniref:Protein transport protein sec13 n=1 Tax=Schizosaccharomyces pombe (strain 972 / ATCC 24843) TaxID=284812 RepID=SEC13_SCHPO|nr:COPII-coated vesicle component Sec13 [Schizosaccharomyces pombe]O94319.1 RecName: Full=Protein transport protein sec13 [Schizosaccharomyces pombe 972h-]CAA22129.1 COPII-coated vesicle component Sec13 [Schizosaccharomyces pombe]|eukprot:NP_596692.1 COPII-coated vesicle component Sec13 [Schizosaccharomyces pombe]
MTTVDTQHDDMIHDAILDYYGKRLATCSSDQTIKVFSIENNQQTLLETLRGHSGPVWQLGWAHPKFGTILASASYDGHVIVWRETGGVWSELMDHTAHQASVNAVSWAPHEYGALLACASSDGKVSVLEFKDDGSCDTRIFTAHEPGCNAVCWSPPSLSGSVVGQSPAAGPKKLATAGCDNLVKIWAFDAGVNNWILEDTLAGHVDWTRDVAWAPSVGLTKTYLASASQDKNVFIWTKEGDGPWQKTPLTEEKFPDIAWRVSWSLSGNILAVSCGDNKVYLFKESQNKWQLLNELSN